jgi:hypothetical protein
MMKDQGLVFGSDEEGEMTLVSADASSQVSASEPISETASVTAET